jgi:hypothetical protein
MPATAAIIACLWIFSYYQLYTLNKTLGALISRDHQSLQAQTNVLPSFHLFLHHLHVSIYLQETHELQPNQAHLPEATIAALFLNLAPLSSLAVL